ncbi:MAG TPA: type I glyceraldehyde-3-phosphate dehydrogenase [bacterium]|nr:type I glyceraldehyde-3-phosphate dehydrogenase [bacterium]HPW39152.1 type I glyceraldehyde-3-phosphate dehydrogenase [bacterium]
MRTIAINGFGRIGRAAFKIALANRKIKIAALNDLTDTKTLAYLLKYDSAYGRFKGSVGYDAQHLIVNGKKYPVLSQPDPAKLPWKKMKVDVVLECTGVFDKNEDLKKHLRAGAKKVILSAPAKDEMTQTLVLGTESTRANLGKNDRIISNASCTTNCIAPIMQVLVSKFGVEKAIMTTVHAYTASQKLVDSPDAKDLRRGRAGAVNLVPSTTGAAKATAKVVPQLKDKFDGIAIRVPVICGSLADITVLLTKETTVEKLNRAFMAAAQSQLYKNILAVTGDLDQLGSADIIGLDYSCLIDLPFTRLVGGNLAKILAWYDNEWGYSRRLVEMALLA